MTPHTIAGVDTGGTFTDAIILEGESVIVSKVPSQPEDPSLAVLASIRPFIKDFSRSLIRHGSTVATNALLEGKGARTGFITNEGFVDLIEIGRQDRENLWDLNPSRPTPLVPRSLRFGIEERVESDGRRSRIPSRDELEDLCSRLAECDLEAIAIGFLHSYRTPDSEMEVGKFLTDLNLPISLSHDVAGEIREFERFSTTIINACVTPIMKNYLDRLSDRLQGARVFVMQSSGGTAPLEVVSRYPCRTVLSGPAGGVYGAWKACESIPLHRAITLDMGGTSTDVALIDGEPALQQEHKIAGHTIMGTALGIHTVGAGGGSLAWIDDGGALRVGPQSAGAQPGPACYGRGGGPTVTDAHCYLGRLPSDGLLGGTFPLSTERAAEEIEKLASRLDADPHEVALGILSLADVAMEGAIRTISLQKGHDPRDFCLVAFGGAGGLHAVRMAKALGMQGVMIPQHAGVLSALGMASAPTRRDLARSVLLSASTGSREFERVFVELETKGKDELSQEFVDSKPRVIRMSDCRYRGQSHSISIPFGKELEERFHQEHHRQYGHHYLDVDVEVVSLRVQIISKPMRCPKTSITKTRLKVGPVAKSFGHFPHGALPVYLRDQLPAGTLIDGPALIAETSGTTIIEKEARLRVHEAGHLMIRI